MDNLRVYLFRRMSKKFNSQAIEAELELLESSENMEELLVALRITNAKLEQLGLVNSVRITLDSGPLELTGTVNVIVEAFADLSFDLPIKWFRERGVRGHIFARVRNLANDFPDCSFHKFKSLRSSVGVGIVVLTKRFCLEGNCYMFKQHDLGRGGTGFEFSISAAA